jgi:polar amino acid transport system substrate-binding protein
MGHRALAEPTAALPVYVMVVEPMTVNAADRKGIVGDIVEEALQRAGYTALFEVLPAPRALSLTPTATNTLIIPLARLAEREQNYTWISPIIKVQRAFFTTNKAINSFEEAKRTLKKIAVSRDTAGFYILLDQGFSRDQIVEIKEQGVAPKMLLAGHVDGWFNPVSEANVLLPTIDKEHSIVHGIAMGESVNYLACSKKCDTQIVDKVRGALKAMESDGSLDRIVSKYGDIEGLTVVGSLH